MASRWKPKNRRTILQLGDEGSQSPIAPPGVGNPTPALAAAATVPNKLHALLGHYSSGEDESADEEKPGDAVFTDFMKEIKAADSAPPAPPPVPSVWQELWDPQSGQPYYWHTITNELTWDRPQDLTKTPASTSSANVKQENTAAPPSISVAPSQKPSVTTKTVTPLDEAKVPTVKDESANKVSFKLVHPAKSATGSLESSSQSTVQAKTNGQLTIDADEIIAAIEKEIPPDYQKQQIFVPLFRRRVAPDRPKLGTDFKTFFPVQHQPALNLMEDPGSLPALTNVVNTHRGFGYHEEEGKPPAAMDDSRSAIPPKKDKVAWVTGEILTPMVIPPTPLTLEEKIRQLENRSEEDPLPVEWSAQLDVLKDAWRKKKLESDYLEEWVDSKLGSLTKKEPEKVEIQPIEKAEIKEEAEENQDQVVDMVLEDSSSEKSETPIPSEVAACPPPEEMLDSALSSFYTDLAELDAAASSEPPKDENPLPPPSENPAVMIPTLPKVSDPVTEPTTTTSTEEVADLAASTTNIPDPVRAVKRTKMSSDMTSLVAKWQKINQSGSSNS